jgi:hypothetical protein
MKKKIIIISVIFIIITILILIFTYNFIKNGHTNINKSDEEIVDKILNITSYNAKLEVEIETNKNKTKYVIKQSVTNNTCKQEILEPSNIAGVITEYDGKDLKITNSQLELTTLFENYNYVVENNLWLNSFIEEFKNSENTEIKNENNEIVLTIKGDNKYSAIKKLYIDKKTEKPTKLTIQDINKKVLIYILYSELEIS